MPPQNIYSHLLVVFLLCVITSGQDFPECASENIGTFIEDPDNCLKYIYCGGSDSFSEFCDTSNPYFSKETNCDTNIEVCGSRPISPALAPTTSTTATTVAAASTTATPTVSASSTSSTAASTTVTADTSVTICPNTDDPNTPVFISNNKSCSDYYLCYHGQPVAMHCSNMLHFDMKQQKCDVAEHVQCKIDIVTPREQCQPHTVDVYPHSNNCNYYYLCEMGYLMIMQCAFNEGWDYEKRVCVLLPKAKCYNSVLRE